MTARFSLIAGIVSAMLFSSQLMAIPFPSLDARTLAMGGAGVAAGERDTAALMNPALMSISDQKKDYYLSFLPIYGSNYLDEKGGMSEVYIYQDNHYEFFFNQKMQAFANLNGSSPSFTADSQTARIEIIQAGRKIIEQLQKMSNKVVQVEKFAGAVVDVGFQKLDMALVLNTRSVSGGLIRVQNSDISKVQAIIDFANQDALLQTEPFRVNADEMDSTFEMRGVVVNEVGLAVSRNVSFLGVNFSLGLTPKYLAVTSFDYVQEINDARLYTDVGTAESTGFSLDVGLAKKFNDHWKMGLTMKDLIPHESITVSDNTIKIMPKARVGLARETSWSTVTMDLDLIRTRPAGFESKMQFAAIGAELDVTKSAQMRFGYRINLADDKVSMITLGAGFSFESSHLDLAIGLNEDALGYSAQYGFHF